MDKKQFPKIKLLTLPNGYALTIEDEEYMYLSLADLLCGFIAHVGEKENKPMDKGTILSGIFSAMMGEEYSNAVTTLKQRVGLLSSRYEATLERMDKSIEYVNSAIKQIEGMKLEIQTLSDNIKGTNTEFEETRSTIQGYQNRMNALDKKSRDVLESLANSATIMKAMEEAGKGKKKQDTGDGNDEKSDQGASEDVPPVKGKKGTRNGHGGRKANDEAVLKAIAKQAKDNPSIK